MIRAVLLLSLLALAACAGDIGARRADGTCPLIRLAEIPLEARSNMLFVQAKIGTEPVTLLLDTGAERTLLTEAAVNRLQLPRDYQHATRTFGIGSPTAAWDAKLPDGLVLGTTRFPVDSVTVGQFAINQIAGGPADGLLGADILLAFDLDLDLPANHITVYRARRECPDATPPWKEPYVAVNGIGTQRDRLLVPFELDGVAGMGILDTGAQLSSVSQRMAERTGVGLEQLAADRTVIAHGAAPEHVPVRIHRFRELRVGPALLRDPLLPVVPMSSSMGDALVGADFLQDRRVWLSFSTNRMFITPLERGPWIAVTQTAK
ncbi:MAG: retropepsin-like aspartic protease [Acetobacteraceae bacterium]